MNVSLVLSKLVGRLIAYLPFSLLQKLGDGKLSKAEIAELKEDIIEIVTEVLGEVYTESKLGKKKQEAPPFVVHTEE